jgi:carboxypeptidase D
LFHSGVGYSTADSSGFAAGQVAVANDFANFLVNLVAVFPSLATRPFYLTGESYAGRYIPYIAKKLLSMKDSPVKLVKIAVASPALGTAAEFKTMPVLQTLETHPAIIDYDVEVYNYFQEQYVVVLIQRSLYLTGRPQDTAVRARNQLDLPAKRPYSVDPSH